MEYGICLKSVVPVRSEPAHKAEMVTQILFGELCRISERESSWLKVVLSFDHYEGWIDEQQVCFIEEYEYTRLSEAETFITADLVQIISGKQFGTMVPVVAGSSLPGLREKHLIVSGEKFYYDGAISTENICAENSPNRPANQLIHHLIEDAMLYLSAPYLWGGRSPFGIDCSGFTQMAYKLQGLKLLRDASQQATQGEVVSLLAEALPGDLAFFDNSEGVITHVGIILDAHRIIHCSGEVKIEPLDHEGIYNKQLNRYTHKLRLIKRIIGN